MTITASAVATGPFEHHLLAVSPLMRRSCSEQGAEAHAAVADMGDSIAALSRAVVLRELGSCGTRAVAHAATRLARGGTIVVVSDMSMPSQVYSRLTDAGHRGEVRLTTPQRLRRPGATIPTHDVLVVDLDSLECSRRDNPSQMWQILSTAAAGRRVLVAAHPHTRGLGACLKQLSDLGGQFTVIDIS